MKKFFNYNGRFFEQAETVVSADNSSYRYGDGLFETMKFVNGNILFEEYHFERLFSGLKILKFNTPSFFTKQKILEETKALCLKNKCEVLARVRLSVSRGNGGLYDCDNKFSYLIECRTLEQPNTSLNGNGLIIDVFPDARKSVDAFSNLKSANYLPYVMAAVWAKENKLNDALILNQHYRICDATIANVFWVKDNKIHTPPLSEGCVAGVMRRKILDVSPGSYREQVAGSGLEMNESLLTEGVLEEAEEIFLTNVTTGIRWVKQCGKKVYQNTLTSKVFAELKRTIYS